MRLTRTSKRSQKDLLYRSLTSPCAARRQGSFARQLKNLSGNPSNFYIFPETGFRLVSMGIMSHCRKNSSSEFRNAWPPHLHSTPLGAGVSSQELSFTNSKTKNLHGDMDPSQVDYYIGLFTHVTPLCPPSFLYSQLESRRQ